MRFEKLNFKNSMESSKADAVRPFGSRHCLKRLLIGGNDCDFRV